MEQFPDNASGSNGITKRYDVHSLISKPIRNSSCTIPNELLEFDYSYGYDCKRYFNLCKVDENVLVFASGNLIHFFHVGTRTVTTRRSSTGGGIGCITVWNGMQNKGFRTNPSEEFSHLTVGENGSNPPIIIYQYPEMTIVGLLTGGTTGGYSRIDYTVDGKLLIAQGIEPDYMLTVWNWAEGEIVLRCKSFSNDVINVMFSPSVPGHITTCGLGHIKFWKMSHTFTGLKLQGELGRFGKTEISDIVGILPLPDEKVLSGCQWGNVLVWEAGLIKLEVCRKGRKPCHEGPITQLHMRAGEVMTVGLDGRIKIWFWETVELADPPDDDRFVEIEPIMEFRIGGDPHHHSELMCLVGKAGDYEWYAQDGNGGIWLCDLTPAHHTEPPQQLLKCHAGPIVAVQASPVSSHVATLGTDGMLCVYDYAKRELLLSHRFQCTGRTMLWLPPTLDPTGAILVLGFSDGFVRAVALNLHDGHLSYPENRVNLIQLLKPHAQPVTALALNGRETILVSGAEDRTIFVHRCVRGTPHVAIEPIGLVYTPSAVTSINWKPGHVAVALVGCRHGQLLEVELPETPVDYTTISYHLRHVEIKQLTFQSVKSEIKRNLRVADIERRRQEKRARKLQTLETMRREDPRAEVNEEAFLADSDAEEEELEPLYIPKVPSAILWARYTDEDTLWLSMGGYDAGYVYEYGFDDEDPISCTPIPEAEDTELTCYLQDTHYTIFGTGDGALRVTRTKEDFRDLGDCWTLPMHDNRTGRITGLAFSYDYSHIFSTGTDGNLFAYRWYSEGELFQAVAPKPLEKSVKRVFDIDERGFPSLEEQKARQERDRLERIVAGRKDAVLATVTGHRAQFEALLERNRALPESYRIPVTDFVLDERITDDLRRQLDAEMALVHRRMAFDVEKVRITADKLNRFFLAPLESFPVEVLAVSTGQSVKSFRIEKLDDDYFKTVKLVEQMVEEEENRRRHPETSTDTRKDRRKDSQLQRKESFLEGLSQSTIDFKLESKMRRLLSKYRERKNQETIRQQEWEEHKVSKPDPNVNDPADDLAIREAASSIGDYNLKSDPEYEPTEERVETTTGKYHELLRVRREMFALRNEFNGKVFALREQKVELRRYVEKQKSKLREIHVEIPADKRKQLPREVVIDVALEYADDQYKFEEDRKSIVTVIQDLTRKQGVKGTPEYYDAILQEALGLDRVDGAKGSVGQSNKHEQELRELRLVRKLFKQDKIIDKVVRRIAEFDKALEKLSHERLVVETDAKLLENFQLTLYQELWILKDFSAIETDILGGVEQVTIERNGLLQAVQDARATIERVEQEIELIQKEQRSNLQRFNSTCLDNEFAKVMKRIYKKKYKPCKINDNDSDSSSEYSSEDIDGLDAAANDGEVSKVFLDLNHCPAGCDPDTYNLAIQLRNEKLELQRRHYAEDRTLRELHKTLEHLKPQLADAEQRLGRKKHELLELRREKQRRLNDIDTLVMVKMDQMQYFRIETEFHDVEHSLLFNREALLKLYARVDQLAAETLETKRRHRVNVVHLARMKTDIKYMRQQLVTLREEIGQTMVKKFGRVIDLDELEETILRQYTFEMRANLDDVKKNYDERTRELKKLYSKKRDGLKKVIQEGTEKLHVLTVLQEEYNNLEKALAHQKELQEKRAHPPPTYSDDLSKLREIAKIQKEQVNTLQREIRTLSMKCKPLSAESPDVEITIPPPVCGKPPPIPDESVYNAVMDSAPPSTRASTPDNFLYNEIASLIDDFLVEQLGSRVLQSDIKRVVNHLAHYLSNIIHNFAPEHASDLLPHIIENFKSFIPEELLITIPPQAIAELIESIFRTFKEGYDIDTKEILGEIVGNSLEMIFPASQNYSHNILVDIMKQVLATLHIADVNHPDTIGFIANGIRHKPGIDPDGVDVALVGEELLLYAHENTVDDISLELIKGVLEGILQCVRDPPEP